MHRREIRLINLDPVVDNDGANTTAQRLGKGVVTIVPVTCNTNNVYPFQTLLPADETGLDTFNRHRANVD